MPYETASRLLGLRLKGSPIKVQATPLPKGKVDLVVRFLRDPNERPPPKLEGLGYVRRGLMAGGHVKDWMHPNRPTIRVVAMTSPERLDPEVRVSELVTAETASTKIRDMIAAVRREGHKLVGPGENINLRKHSVEWKILLKE